MTKKIKDPFGTAFSGPVEISEDHRVTDPHPEPRRPTKAQLAAVPAAPVGAYAPLYLSAKGLAWMEQYWEFKRTGRCHRCGERRFVNFHDVGAGSYGPPGCQIGICASCGEDLKRARPQRRRLKTWEGG